MHFRNFNRKTISPVIKTETIDPGSYSEGKVKRYFTLHRLPAHPVIPKDEIHVWSSSLAQPSGFLEQLAQTLSEDERKRAERFRFDIHRKRYIAGRGLLRTILGAYLQKPPQSLCFGYGPHGKPFLLQSQSRDRFHFNVSHSRDRVLYAVTREREIGVDIEYIRHYADFEQIAERFFSPAEYSALKAVRMYQKRNAFYKCWTRKEAFIKAIGNGLAHPLDRFEVTLTPSEPARLLTIDGDEHKAAEWTLTELLPGQDYIAAIAFRGQNLRLSCYSL